MVLNPDLSPVSCTLHPFLKRDFAIKLPCRQQMGHCLDCANFCTSRDNIQEYEKEIQRVKDQLSVSKALGRTEWEEKNQKYLDVLKKMLAYIQKDGVIHKSGSHREECDA